MAKIPNLDAVRRTGAALVSAVALTTGVTACAQHEVEAEPSIGQVEHTAKMKALGLALVTDGEGAARLVGTLMNTGTRVDRLVRVDLRNEVPPEFVAADVPIILRPGDSVRLARDAEMTILADDFRPGFRKKLSLYFENSAPIVTTVPVETQSGPYAEVEVRRPPDGDISPS